MRFGAGKKTLETKAFGGPVWLNFIYLAARDLISFNLLRDSAEKKNKGAWSGAFTKRAQGRRLWYPKYKIVDVWWWEQPKHRINSNKKRINLNKMI